MRAFRFVQIWALFAIGAAAIPTPVNVPAALTSQLEPRAEEGGSAGNNIHPQSQEKSPLTCIWCGKKKSGGVALVGHMVYNHGNDELVARIGKDAQHNRYEKDKEGFRYYKKYPGVKLPPQTWRAEGV
ncbi:uncharacterized protein PpBr36_10295 [Pyricularia pennisetigena]|uniref:uncharacterized protein n=1 Tax=Pyricularia pennisetigena TaxID=1578925 RepID=UPI001153F7DD|nr:uncharacterized protein PpBr36_10295 [Pyricularia pennisetigena]TLS21566.1 hypothetical protein PpBr36_10295 [Pyricularia pennisetigena]